MWHEGGNWIEKRTAVELRTDGQTTGPTARAKAQHLKERAAPRHLAAVDDSRRGQSALIRVARRDSFRATVFRWSTRLVIARCSSGWASWNADLAASLSPLAIAVSTFLTKVRTRLVRARLIAVRLA